MIKLSDLSFITDSNGLIAKGTETIHDVENLLRGKKEVATQSGEVKPPEAVASGQTEKKLSDAPTAKTVGIGGLIAGAVVAALFFSK